MAQIVLKKENVQKKPIEETPIIDWDLYLYPLWLQKMALNPFFQDAKVQHNLGTCPCHCTPNLYLKEVRKHK